MSETDHYVSMARIRATKKKKKKTSSIEEVFSDPLSTVSSEEDNTSTDFDSPSCSTSGTSTPAKSSQSMESPYEIFAPSTRKVMLRPGSSGLGLSVAGGVQSPTGLLPVFITDIDPGGLAEQSQSLKVGDCILRVNGEDMEGKKHRDVVLSIKAAGNSLMLEVTESPENIMKYVNIEQK